MENVIYYGKRVDDRTGVYGQDRRRRRVSGRVGGDGDRDRERGEKGE